MPLVALSGVTVGLEGQIYTAHVSKQVRRRLMHGQEWVKRNRAPVLLKLPNNRNGLSVSLGYRSSTVDLPPL